MKRADFYNVALQLLGFEAFSDFDLSDPISFMTATKLPSVAHDLLHTADLLQASYLLLTTRTKHLVSFLDDLANRGFLRIFRLKVRNRLICSLMARCNRCLMRVKLFGRLSGSNQM